MNDDSFYYLKTDVEQDFERTGDNEAFTAYERKRVTHLKNRLEREITNYQRVEDKDDLEVKTISDVVRINDVLSDYDSVIRDLSEDKKVSYSKVQTSHETLVCSLQRTVERIDELDLPQQKSRQCIRADSGPGVGYINNEVKFRMAEIARISDADIRIKLHGLRGDSGQNEAEQTNSGVSNAICDGGTIEWETHKRFEGMTKEEIDNLTLEQYNDIEEKRDKEMHGTFPAKLRGE